MFWIHFTWGFLIFCSLGFLDHLSSHHWLLLHVWIHHHWLLHIGVHLLHTHITSTHGVRVHLLLTAIGIHLLLLLLLHLLHLLSHRSINYSLLFHLGLLFQGHGSSGLFFFSLGFSFFNSALRSSESCFSFFHIIFGGVVVPSLPPMLL